MPQYQTVAVPKRWPLVNQFQSRSPTTPLNKDARLVNCYAEYDAEDKDYWIYKRLGIASTAYITEPTSASIVAQGMISEQNLGIFHISGGNAYLNSGATLGAVDSTCQYSFEFYLSTLGSAPHIVMHNTVKGYVYTGTLAAITDSQFTSLATQGLAPGLVSLNGTYYIMSTAGAIQGSNVNDPTVWPATNQIFANNDSDSGVFLAKQLSYIIAFKQWSTQVFYDTGTGSPGSTLAPVQDAQVPFGCLYPYSVSSIDGILLWMTSNKTISPQVIMMENLRSQIISTPAVERILDNITDPIQKQLPAIGLGGVWSWTMKHGGHRFYGISSLNLGLTLVYDIDQKLWLIWQSQANWTVGGASVGPWLPLNLAYTYPSPGGTPTITGYHIAQSPFGGIYVIDGDYEYPNDQGTLFPVDIYTPNFDGGTTRRKHLNALYFTTDMVPGSSLQCRYSDDDFNSWSNFRTIDLNQPKPFLDREGTFENRRAYHFRHQANTTFRIKSGDLQLDFGTL